MILVLQYSLFLVMSARFLTLRSKIIISTRLSMDNSWPVALAPIFINCHTRRSNTRYS